jgi:hypothetical protein
MQNAAVSTKKKKEGPPVFSPQEDGGKVKCKILMKMSPAGNGAFAWYDLTDTKAASQPQSFSAAVANAKWKVLNTNAGYFMGNENSAVFFNPPAADAKAIEASRDPAKILLATMAKLIGDMSTALASSEWMAQFHPGGSNALSDNWIDAWNGVPVVDLPIPVNILGESGDRLQVWQGSDRNGATLYTGSRQDENNMQTAKFIPSHVDPDRLLNSVKSGLAALHATLDYQYSTLLMEVNRYLDDIRKNGHEGLFKDTAYAGVKEANRLYVTEQLGIYLSYVHGQIEFAYNQAKAQGGILHSTTPEVYDGLSLDDITKLRDDLSLRIVDLMPQKTSLFIKAPTKLHKAFQIKKGVALLPSPSDAITKINTTARYRTQRGGATINDALDAFAIALRISMPPTPADPMFLQFANMIPSAAAAPVAAPVELGDGEAPLPIDFGALFVPPDAATITRARDILNDIHEPMLLHEKWDVMSTIWGARGKLDRLIDQKLWDEIQNSYQIDQDADENLSSDAENLQSIINSPPSIAPTPATNDTLADAALINFHFVRYGERVGGELPERFSSDIPVPGSEEEEEEDAAAAAAAAPYPYRGFLAEHHPTLGTSGPGRSKTGGPLDPSSSASSSSSAYAAVLRTAQQSWKEKHPAPAAPAAAAAEAEQMDLGRPRRKSMGALGTLGVKRPLPEAEAEVKDDEEIPLTQPKGGHRKTYRRRRLPKLL